MIFHRVHTMCEAEPGDIGERGAELRIAIMQHNQLV